MESTTLIETDAAADYVPMLVKALQRIKVATNDKISGLDLINAIVEQTLSKLPWGLR